MPISAGDNHDGIIDDQGRLYMSGDNDFGQLGIGRAGGSEEDPVIVPFELKVISISCGIGISGAVTEDGKVYVWGDNGEKILSEKSEDDSIVSPYLLKLPRKATKIACGGHSFAVILDDLSVYFKAGKQMTLDTISQREASEMSIHSIPNASGIHKLNAIDIVVGNGTFAAINISGKLYLWGLKMWRRSNMKNYVLYPVHIPFPEPIEQVSLGTINTTVLTKSGKVHSWYIGNKITKSYRHSSDKSEQSRLIAIHLDGIDKLELKFPVSIGQISIGEYLNSAVGENGELYTWVSRSRARGMQSIIREIDIGFPVVFNLVFLDDRNIVAMTTDGYINYGYIPKRLI